MMDNSATKLDRGTQDSCSLRQKVTPPSATARHLAGNPLWEASSDSDAWTDDDSEVSSDDSDDDSDDNSNDDCDAETTGSGSKQKPSVPRVCACCMKNEKDLPGPLKHCARCKRTLYCSRECQSSNWKRHKKLCGLDSFNGLPEKVVFAHLIDAYRLRVEDDYVFNGNVYNSTIYGGGDPTRHFQRYWIRPRNERTSFLTGGTRRSV